MPIRGMRSIWPPKGKKPTGIFSSRGSQKNDGNGNAPDVSAMKAAHKNTNDYSNQKKPYSAGSASLRHQKPAGGKSKSYGRM